MSGWILLAIVLTTWVTISLVGAICVGLVIRQRDDMEAPQHVHFDQR
ncbi:hypothetical protein AAFP30_16180 [Gordonia sp. CPCC 205515]